MIKFKPYIDEGKIYIELREYDVEDFWSEGGMDNFDYFDYEMALNVEETEKFENWFSEILPNSFWKLFEEGSVHMRLHLLDYVVNMVDFPIKEENMRKEVMKTSLLGYFEDLIEYKNQNI